VIHQFAHWPDAARSLRLLKAQIELPHRCVLSKHHYECNC
jgi:hypothetical protein